MRKSRGFTLKVVETSVIIHFSISMIPCSYNADFAVPYYASTGFFSFAYFYDRVDSV